MARNYPGLSKVIEHIESLPSLEELYRHPVKPYPEEEKHYVTADGETPPDHVLGPWRTPTVDPGVEKEEMKEKIVAFVRDYPTTHHGSGPTASAIFGAVGCSRISTKAEGWLRELIAELRIYEKVSTHRWYIKERISDGRDVS